jgi:hypothetical protein
VIHGGDLTEKATRDEFTLMRDILRQQSLPVYACIGNHDRYLPTSRSDLRELLAGHFPDGELDYAFLEPPLRFVVMDVALEDQPVRARKVQWLRDTLENDTTTPTIFIWHYPRLQPWRSVAVWIPPAGLESTRTGSAARDASARTQRRRVNQWP